MSKIAFFGTPEFAIPSLIKTHDFCSAYGHELLLVVTQPDRPHGRGFKISKTPVKAKAEELGLLISQPSSLKRGIKEGDDFYELFKNLKIDLAIVVAYGAIITKRLLMASNLGFINIHASLLPKYRGASPIQSAIINGDSYSGICLMKMSEKLDEGDVFLREPTMILPFDTGYSLSLRLSHLGAHILKNNLSSLIKNELLAKPQGEGVNYAQKLSKDEGLLNFYSKGKILNRKVRALDPWPSAYAFFRGKRIKFFNSFFVPMMFNEVPPATIVAIQPNIGISCIDGVIFFEASQIEGKAIQKSSLVAKSLRLEVGDVID